MATFRARFSALTSCSPSRCLLEAFVLRRSPLCIRVWVLPSSAPTLSRETSLGSHRSRSRPRALSRAHLFRVYRAHLSTITGNTSRLTVHGLREFVSRFDECWRRPSSSRRSRPLLAPGNLDRPGLSTMTFAVPYSSRVSCPSFDVHAPRFAAR